MYTYKALVLRVIDGDTFIAEVDLGFNIIAKIHFRLRNIDTPEIRGVSAQEREKGLQAKSYAQSLIEGKPVMLHTYKEAVYNRWECDCILSDGSDLAQLLQTEGFLKEGKTS